MKIDTWVQVYHIVHKRYRLRSDRYDSPPHRFELLDESLEVTRSRNILSARVFITPNHTNVARLPTVISSGKPPMSMSSAPFAPG